MLLGRVATAPLSGLVTLLESSVRSYLVGNAGSRPISEAKQPWACLVLRWGTTGEAHVLYSPQISFFQVKNLTWRLYLCIFCTHALAPLLSSLPQLTSVVRFTSNTTLEQEQHPPHSVLFNSSSDKEHKTSNQHKTSKTNRFISKNLQVKKLTWRPQHT